MSINLTHTRKILHVDIYLPRVYYFSKENTHRGYARHIMDKLTISKENKECCREGRTKHRSEKEYKDLMNRLKRIEGQVRGVQKMLENEAYCPDILVQVSAINCALNSFSKKLLASHMKSCVVEDIKNGREETIDELVETLQKVMK